MESHKIFQKKRLESPNVWFSILCIVLNSNCCLFYFTFGITSLVLYFWHDTKIRFLFQTAKRAFRMNKFDLAVRPIYHRLRNRIEGHICICFTAYTIMLELERILKAAKSEITIYRAQELTKSMYAITYTLPRSKQTKKVYLGMDE